MISLYFLGVILFILGYSLYYRQDFLGDYADSFSESLVCVTASIFWPVILVVAIHAYVMTKISKLDIRIEFE